MIPLFEIQNMSKHYVGVVANDDVNFDIAKGSIHSLLGENGAGKSTLVKMIYGLVRPTSGIMTYNGTAYAPEKPSDARNQGVGMVFQHFSLFDALTVAENIEVGMENPPERKDLIAKIVNVSNAYGLPLDPYRVVGELSVGERQRVEIIRCLLQNPKLLIMDEPTSVLTPGEVDILFETLRKLRDEGVSILYISHKLEEIRAICDRATVLRRGKVVGDCDPREKSAKELAEMMVGEALVEAVPRQGDIGAERLKVSNASLTSQYAFGASLKNISFSVNAGEILGVAGVAGNGQEELLAILTGEDRVTSGQIQFDHSDIAQLSAKKRRELGVIGAPEERLGHAAVPSMSLSENAMLTGQERAKLSKGSWLNWRAAQNFADEVIEKFDVRTAGNHVSAGSLSGGNLQKFVVGREIMQNPEVLVVNQPTWGVDVAAAGFIRQALRDLSDSGAAVIVISQDLDEIFELADSVVALCEGRLSPKFPMSDIDIQKIGSLMGGEF